MAPKEKVLDYRIMVKVGTEKSAKKPIIFW